MATKAKWSVPQERHLHVRQPEKWLGTIQKFRSALGM